MRIKPNLDARHHLEAAQHHKVGDFVKARESSFKAIEYQCIVYEHPTEDLENQIAAYF